MTARVMLIVPHLAEPNYLCLTVPGLLLPAVSTTPPLSKVNDFA